MKGAYLEHLTWPEAQALFAKNPVAVLPIGARCKEHGHHLPLNTDWLQAEYYAQALAERLEIVVLPTVQYGHYPAFIEYPGSINLGEDTFKAMLLDICHSLTRHGISRIYALNMGISTLPSLAHAHTVLTNEGFRFAYCDPGTMVQELENQIQEQAHGGHGDELETSCLLAIAPDRVQMDKATKELNIYTGKGLFHRTPDAPGFYSPSGIRGDAKLATKAKGKVLVTAITQKLVDQIQNL